MGVTATTKHALVHGDISPKNILVGPGGPVFLDAECAWWGDPAFDLAFCLNHLLLKGLWNRGAQERFLDAFGRMSESYLAGVTWEPPADVEARAARLLPGAPLLLPAALVGALLVLAADLVGSNLLFTTFPVGVVTGAIGAPYLLWLVARSNRIGGRL